MSEGTDMTGDAPKARSAHALANLARAGYWSLRQPLTEVDFEVHHLVDRPGYLVGLVTGEGRGEPKSRFFLETLSSSAHGAGLVVGIRTGEKPDRLRIRDHGSTVEPELDFGSDELSHVFRGTARPNLTFLAESDRRFEGIIAIADEPAKLRLSHGNQIKNLLVTLSQIAVEVARAPLLSIQCPVQLPVEVEAEYREERIPRAAALAVRFSIALQHPSAELTFEIADRIIRYCDERGFRLWLADTRLGHRTGNWFRIRAHPVEEPHPSEEPEGVLSTIIPVTFVGPARVGSTHALVSLLLQFPEIGVVGASITLLDDLAFIHLQLGVVTPAEEVALPVAHSSEDPRTAITTMLAGFAKVPNGKHGQELGDHLWERAGDYQTLAGPVVPVVHPAAQRRLAIWISWQMERTSRGISVAVRALRQAFDYMGFPLPEGDATGPEARDAPNLEYLICRDLGNSLLRGKGKFSVPLNLVQQRFTSTAVEIAPSKLCVGLEDAWKTALDEDPGGYAVREVTVVWREYWLGHWAATSV
ncbi:hypothetical protein ACWED2_22855 [Amycolatopsis sp. NPDC005003]